LLEITGQFVSALNVLRKVRVVEILLEVTWRALLVGEARGFLRCKSGERRHDDKPFDGASMAQKR
jgi:hypothetical protein